MLSCVPKRLVHRNLVPQLIAERSDTGPDSRRLVDGTTESRTGTQGFKCQLFMRPYEQRWLFEASRQLSAITSGDQIVTQTRDSRQDRAPPHQRHVR